MKYYVVDAFAEKLFSGNPAGVCLLKHPLPDETMQRIAAENNLAETAFVLRQPDGVYNLRWFTPEQEFDLCGHATLASAYVLFEFVEQDVQAIRFTTQSGILTVVRKGNLLEMDFPARPPVKIPVVESMGVAVGMLVLEAHLSRDMILVMPSEESVSRASPDLELVAKIPKCVNLIITAPGAQVDFVSRYFTPGISIPEDPVTGSAHASLIPFWAKRLNKMRMIARQLSRRGGTLYCEDHGDRVKISGKAMLYLSGEIHF